MDLFKLYILGALLTWRKDMGRWWRISICPVIICSDVVFFTWSTSQNVELDINTFLWTAQKIRLLYSKTFNMESGVVCSQSHMLTVYFIHYFSKLVILNERVTGCLESGVFCFDLFWSSFLNVGIWAEESHHYFK